MGKTKLIQFWIGSWLFVIALSLWLFLGIFFQNEKSEELEETILPIWENTISEEERLNLIDPKGVKFKDPFLETIENKDITNCKNFWEKEEDLCISNIIFQTDDIGEEICNSVDKKDYCKMILSEKQNANMLDKFQNWEVTELSECRLFNSNYSMAKEECSFNILIQNEQYKKEDCAKYIKDTSYLIKCLANKDSNFSCNELPEINRYDCHLNSYFENILNEKSPEEKYAFKEEIYNSCKRNTEGLELWEGENIVKIYREDCLRDYFDFVYSKINRKIDLPETSEMYIKAKVELCQTIQNDLKESVPEQNRNENVYNFLDEYCK